MSGIPHHVGDGKPPPPMVNPMQHADALACTEWEVPYHGAVCQGGVKEAHMPGGGKSEGEFREGLPGLRGTAGNSHLVQVYRTGPDGRG